MAISLDKIRPFQDGIFPTKSSFVWISRLDFYTLKFKLFGCLLGAFKLFKSESVLNEATRVMLQSHHYLILVTETILKWLEIRSQRKWRIIALRSKDFIYTKKENLNFFWSWNLSSMLLALISTTWILKLHCITFKSS